MTDSPSSQPPPLLSPPHTSLTCLYCCPAYILVSPPSSPATHLPLSLSSSPVTPSSLFTVHVCLSATRTWHHPAAANASLSGHKAATAGATAPADAPPPPPPPAAAAAPASDAAASAALPASHPGARSFHAAASIGRNMFVFGGRSGRKR